jgi:hypothetical protein
MSEDIKDTTNARPEEASYTFHAGDPLAHDIIWYAINHYSNEGGTTRKVQELKAAAKAFTKSADDLLVFENTQASARLQARRENRATANETRQRERRAAKAPTSATLPLTTDEGQEKATDEQAKSPSDTEPSANAQVVAEDFQILTPEEHAGTEATPDQWEYPEPQGVDQQPEEFVDL